MRKETLYGKEAREKIMSGVRKIVSAIKVTLGPAGRNVIISKAIFHDYAQIPLPLHITKDGVTVAHAFELDDHMERPGVLLVKEACQKTVDQAGDGTTTCAVLLEAIATLALEKIWRIGGNAGWYYADWLWEVRGLLDQVFGGVGVRRGRRSDVDIQVGDALDFWRVLWADKDQKRFYVPATALEDPMSLPGGH
jgi:hypothetical protein